MSITLKAFIVNHTLTNNLENQISDVGEISTYARTFSRDQQSLTSTNHPGFEVLVFHASKEGQSGVFNVHDPIKDMLLDMSKWLYETAASSFNINTTSIDVAAAIKNRYNEFVGNILVGSLVPNNNYYLPSKLEINITLEGQEPIKAILYTTNTIFEHEYDETKILIVPPFENIDVLLSGPVEVKAAVDKVSQIEVFDRITNLIEKKPPTTIQPVEIEWIQPSPGNAKIVTTWYAIIYGPKGITVDQINQAIRNHILAKSTSGEAAWKAVMPDIFLITRFFLIPQWSSIAMQGRGPSATIYSPVQNLGQIQDLVRSYDLTQLGLKEDQIEVFNHPYRSLSMLVLSGKDNKTGSRSLKEIHPDYIAAESLHEDYNRQASDTILFSNLLLNLIVQAEDFTMNKTLKPGFRSLEFGGKTCISGKFKNIEYIIQTRIQSNP